MNWAILLAVCPGEITILFELQFAELWNDSRPPYLQVVRWDANMNFSFIIYKIQNMKCKDDDDNGGGHEMTT